MIFLFNLISPFRHCESAVAYLLECINVNYTRSYLQKELTEHPDYPSLMSIVDVTGASYGVASAALQLSRVQILEEPEITTPFLAYMENVKDGRFFAVVSDFSNKFIKIYNPASKKQETLTPDDFDKSYRGTILVVEADSESGEKGFEENSRAQRRKNTIQAILFWGLPVITFLACIITVISNFHSRIIAPVIFTLLSLAGYIISGILLWREVDRSNPVINNFCRPSVRVNCNAVLDSKAARIFGLSWSSIGFCFFLGTLLSLLISGITDLYTLELLSWLNAAALPYVIFSIYYQWKVVKQWCLLCLILQGLIALQFVTSLSGNFHTFFSVDQLPVAAWLSVITAMAFTFIYVLFIIPQLTKATDAARKTIEIQRLKRNPEIFEALLAKQKSVECPSTDLGIIIGNPNGMVRLLKVSNPYCAPCAKAHAIIEELLNAGDDLALQIIFTSTEDDGDQRKYPVNHLLSINAQQNESLTRKALSDWFSAGTKDYDTFASKYPVSKELKFQSEKIQRMREWCDFSKVDSTPTFFISFPPRNDTEARQFCQLPDIYSISDLKYFLLT